MPSPGYQEGSELLWWWKVAQHIDEAQLALVNAMVHNLDDPRPMHALQDRLREGQTILLEIFRMKGLLPAAPSGKVEGRMPAMPMPMPMPMPGMPGMPVMPAMPAMPAMPGMPGMPMAFAPAPSSIGGAGGEVVPAAPTADVEQSLPFAAETSIPQSAAASEPEQPVAAPSPEVLPPAASASETNAVAPPASGDGGAGG